MLGAAAHTPPCHAGGLSANSAPDSSFLLICTLEAAGGGSTSVPATHVGDLDCVQPPRLSGVNQLSVWLCVWLCVCVCKKRRRRTKNYRTWGDGCLSDP